MKIKEKRSLRKCINENCRNCIYDEQAKGTWRQQVTLCTVESCAMYPVRPITDAPIPESVLDYYLVTDAERARYARSRHLQGRFNEHKEGRQYRRRTQDFKSLEKGQKA